MLNHMLYSAPNENYLEHIERCTERFKVIFPLFKNTISRVLQIENAHDEFLKMILFHDLGKLTRKWQENLEKKRPLPSHSSIGASYLWKILPENLREPISFAVTIHHTDKGLLGDNIERPDVQAILEGIADYKGNIVWHERAYELGYDILPKEARELTVYDLREMVRGLRIWARGRSLLEQHKRRLQASLAHHILKLCDISAAIERKEYRKEEKEFYGGWLMVEDIKEYVESKIIFQKGG